MSIRPLTALLLSDGKAGHYTQAEGVVAALGRLRPVEVVRIDLQRRLLLPARILQWLVNARLSPAAVLRLGFGLDPATLPRADVVVSAGGETLAANAAAARLLGCDNIFCGRLRHLAPQHLSLIIVSLERLRTHPNHLVALPPSALEAPGAAGRAHAAPLGPRNPPQRVAVLIGGDSGEVRYEPEDWTSLLHFLRETHRSLGVRWLVTTSRRSPQAVADALASLAAESGSGIERFIDYRASGPGTLAQLLGEADAILVTDDSTKMISEGVGARLPVVAIGPEAVALEKREAEYRAYLVAKGWYRRVPLRGLTPHAFLAALGEICPRATSALDELAAALRERLPNLLAKV